MKKLVCIAALSATVGNASAVTVACGGADNSYINTDHLLTFIDNGSIYKPLIGIKF